jgi:hypothetical protein
LKELKDLKNIKKLDLPRMKKAQKNVGIRAKDLAQ